MEKASAHYPRRARLVKDLRGVLTAAGPAPSLGWLAFQLLNDGGSVVTIPSLWLAILLAAALVWVASSIVWMVLPHHRSDFKPFPDEEAARRLFKGLPPGQYNVPHAATPGGMKDPDFQKKMAEGPLGIFVAIRPGAGMGRSLALYFIYCLFISYVVAYVTTRSLPPGATYGHVFQIAGTVAWLGYGTSIISDAIWMGRPWSYAFKNLADALLYALLTGGVFGWLWQ